MFQNAFRLPCPPEVKAQGEHFQRGAFHELCRFTTDPAIGKAGDAGSLGEKRKLRVNFGIQLRKGFQAGEERFHYQRERGVRGEGGEMRHKKSSFILLPPHVPLTVFKV
jgi:hypothetical protein